MQLVEARNAKAHSVASSSCLELRLAFGGVILDKLRADPFCLPLAYAVRDARRHPQRCRGGRTRDDVVSFGVDRDRAAWKIAGIVGVNDVYRASARRRRHVRLQRRRWLG